jgi:hypothetical protein
MTEPGFPIGPARFIASVASARRKHLTTRISAQGNFTRPFWFLWLPTRVFLWYIPLCVIEVGVSDNVPGGLYRDGLIAAIRIY